MRWVRASRDHGELVYGLVSPDASTDGVLQRLPNLPGVRSMTAYELLQVWPPRGGEAVVVPPAPLDALDRRIIDVLSTDGRTSNREIARTTRVNETTVARHRARLEEWGVLYYGADIAQAAIGRRHDAMLWMDVAPGHIVEAGTRLQALPECRFVAVTSGPSTLVANVATESAPALVALVDTHLAGVVRRVEMLTLGRVFKRHAGPSTPV